MVKFSPPAALSLYASSMYYDQTMSSLVALLGPVPSAHRHRETFYRVERRVAPVQFVPLLSLGCRVEMGRCCPQIDTAWLSDRSGGALSLGTDRLVSREHCEGRGACGTGGVSGDLNTLYM